MVVQSIIHALGLFLAPITMSGSWVLTRYLVKHHIIFRMHFFGAKLVIGLIQVSIAVSIFLLIFGIFQTVIYQMGFWPENHKVDPVIGVPSFVAGLTLGLGFYFYMRYKYL